MSACRSRRSMGEPDYTSSLYPEPPTPLSSVNPIMDALKEGVLKLRSKYRDFTLLLDLQKGYHNHFMTRLFDHVKDLSQFSWDNLEWDGDARRACAESFLEKYGMQYWGEKNREKCLMAESLENPGELCTYPERKEE